MPTYDLIVEAYMPNLEKKRAKLILRWHREPSKAFHAMVKYSSLRPWRTSTFQDGGFSHVPSLQRAEPKSDFSYPCGPWKADYRWTESRQSLSRPRQDRGRIPLPCGVPRDKGPGLRGNSEHPRGGLFRKRSQHGRS